MLLIYTSLKLGRSSCETAFSHVFYPSPKKEIISVFKLHLILVSANAFNLDQYENLTVGKWYYFIM